jgi:hypothetical protein
MSIRTTVALDEDVLLRLREESRARSIPFRTLLNEAVRSGLLAMRAKPRSKPFKVDPVNLGSFPGLDYDRIGALLDFAEGDLRR